MIKIKTPFARSLIMLVGIWLLAACAPSPVVSVTPIPADFGVADSSAVAPAAESAVAAAASDTAAWAEATAIPAPATPTPFPTEVPLVASAGEAPVVRTLAEVRAADVAAEYEPSAPVVFEESPVELHFNEFFVDYDPWSYAEPVMSDKLLALDGERVLMEGYVAPPLKLDLNWFILSSIQLGGCPYCSGAADWTPGIVLVYLDGAEMPYPLQAIRLEGELHVGTAVDDETGMVSLVRIYVDENGIEPLDLGW